MAPILSDQIHGTRYTDILSQFARIRLKSLLTYQGHVWADAQALADWFFQDLA